MSGPLRERVLQRLACLGETRQVWVAFSGGLDSHVLLHVLGAERQRLPGALGAVHVDHGLHPDSGDWARHCTAVCAQLEVPLVTLAGHVRRGAGESPEAAAREARYRALGRWLPAGAVLLTAHHQDDQAETLVLQLLRGAGPHGLAAMAAAAPFANGWLGRPLLPESRAHLTEYARNHDLVWIDDPSNLDPGFDRNRLRREIFPLLRERWPALGATLARSAGHQAEAAALLDELAAEDAARAQRSAGTTLSVSVLRELPGPRRRNLLRYWLRRRGLRPPSSARLARMEHDLLTERADGQPCVAWAKVQVRRYRDRLYVTERLSPPDPRARMHWQPPTPLSLPRAGGVLEALPARGQGLAVACLRGAAVEIGFRRGGERLRPAGRGGRHALKKLLQERGIPPWERERLPLVFVDGELAAVAGQWVCEGFQAEGDAEGLCLCWSRLPAWVC